MSDRDMTIGALAAAAAVNVETVRYYQRRGLLPLPDRGARGTGSVRRYGADDAARLIFIRQAQQLGFTLEEIAELLQLQDGADRRSIRRIASQRLAQIRDRLDGLKRMATVLEHLISECEHSARRPTCPIIDSIVGAPAKLGPKRTD
jgi:MerR family mercuric resistance operon transcriptional regulator